MVRFWLGVKDVGPYARAANSPLNRVYLLNGDDTEKVGMRGAQIGLSGRPKLVLNLWTPFSTYEQPKRRIKVAVLMLLLLAVEKTNTYTGRSHPTYHWRPPPKEEEEEVEEERIHASWQIIINTDGEGQTGKSRMELFYILISRFFLLLSTNHHQ